MGGYGCRCPYVGGGPAVTSPTAVAMDARTRGLRVHIDGVSIAIHHVTFDAAVTTDAGISRTTILLDKDREIIATHTKCAGVKAGWPRKNPDWPTPPPVFMETVNTLLGKRVRIRPNQSKKEIQ